MERKTKDDPEFEKIARDFILITWHGTLGGIKEGSITGTKEIPIVASEEYAKGLIEEYEAKYNTKLNYHYKDGVTFISDKE